MKVPRSFLCLQFGAALLRQLNNEVNKINELIEDGNDLRDSQRLRELGQVSRPGNNDYAPSMKRAGAALNEAAQLQQLQELLSLLKETAAERKGFKSIHSMSKVSYF